MVNNPKLAAYLAKARRVVAASPTPAEIQGMKAHHEGCKGQFQEVGLKLKAAVAANDTNAIKQHEDLLRENFKLREILVQKLKAAGVAIVDDDV